MENTHVLLVESKDHGIYGFPKGKINQEESSESCAMRELRE
jgi:8-oxo-dGTP pyrophosphatase MutT (NUDIX family)